MHDYTTDVVVKNIVVLYRGSYNDNLVYYRFSYDVVSRDVGRDVSTAYCLSSSGDEVDWLRSTICITVVAFFGGLS